MVLLGDKHMTFAIKNTTNGRMVKECCSMQVMTWTKREDAEYFMGSMLANARVDWERKGKRIPKYAIVEVA